MSAAVFLLAAVLFRQHVGAQPGVNLPVYTSPIDVTGGRLFVTAFAPDRNSGDLQPYAVPASALPAAFTAITATPINAVMDARWNGTVAERAAGIAPIQAACDGPNGLRAIISAQVAEKDESAYDISCSFGTTGRVYVKQVGQAFYLSYQILNNSGRFRTTSDKTCHRVGAVFCPNDPLFEIRFAIELLTLVWAPTLCSTQAEPPSVFLHGVQFDSHNAAGDIAMIYDALFEDNQLLAQELAVQAREVRGPISLDPAFATLRSSPACASSSGILRAFTGLELAVGPNVELRAVHPPIARPRFLNVSLPYGPDTCVAGYVWREAFPDDRVCVVPATRAQAAADNAQASARRSPSGGAYGPATCRQSYVWREARVGDLVCVTPATRQQVQADNASASSRKLLQPFATPSFTRPSVSAPPIVGAGDDFTVSGQFFPAASDSTTVTLMMDRQSNSACRGGSTELETKTGPVSTLTKLPWNAGAMSACSYKYAATGLIPGHLYRFRARDCDAVTCSPWSDPFETLIGTAQAPAPVVLTLDTGAVLGSAVTNVNGAFQKSVRMPAGTSPGPHKLSAASGTASDVTAIQVTGRGATARLLLTGSFYGDTGCPMRAGPTGIAAAEPFPLFGSGFAPGLVSLRLDTATGMVLGNATVQGNGTFCGYFSGPPPAMAGNHVLVALQDGAVRATLPVEVVIVKPIH